MIDTYRHKGLRKQLMQTLEGKGITDARVLEAMADIPRHYFFDNAFLQHAYEDKAFPIGAGQTISQPYTVAFQTQLLQVEKGHKVLEIGTGSGYQTAVLCAMGARVYTIERQKELYRKAPKSLADLGYKPQCFFGDGYAGKEAFAPFDRILVTCGAPFIPPALTAQLKDGGRLVIPVGDGTDQEMTLIRKEGAELLVSKHGIFRFVPMLENKN